LEAKVGVNGSAVTSSLDYMVAASKVVTDKVDPASASTNQVLKFNGTKFVPATGASVTVSDSPPTSPTPQAGDQWYESDSGRQLIYYDGFWVEIGSTATTNVNANDLSGTTLASNVVSSSLTAFGSSPVLTGTPTAPTASAGTNTTQIATMASRPWNTAWGVVGHVSSTPGQTVTTVTDMTGITVTFTAVSGRRYISTLALEMYNQNANSLVDIQLADAASSAVRAWTVQMKDSGLQSPFTLIWSESGLSGSTTRKVRFGRGFGNTGNVISFGLQQLTVQDIGPA
jgi:hypothetical protein